MLIKYVEGKSSQGGGSQEYANTLAAHLIIVYLFSVWSFVLTNHMFVQQYRTMEWENVKEKQSERLCLGKKRWKKRRTEYPVVKVGSRLQSLSELMNAF